MFIQYSVGFFGINVSDCINTSLVIILCPVAIDLLSMSWALKILPFMIVCIRDC